MQKILSSAIDSTPPPPQGGRCIGVMPAKGGDGASGVVANLAAAIAQGDRHIRVLVMDLSLPFGDVDLFLQRTPLVHDVSLLCDEVGRVDAALLEVMTEHPMPNLHLVGSPATLERYLHVKPDDVVHLVRLALAQYDWVILDLGLDAIGLSMLDCLHHLLVVTTPHVPSVRRAHQLVRLWQELEGNRTELSLALSLHSARSEIRQRDVEATLGLAVSLVLPRANELMATSLLEGVPAVVLEPRSAYARAVRAWAAQLTGQTPPDTRRSLWQRFVNR
ncbi:MAG: hypothetical protein RI884_702 [Pseudomonadota bacterium]